MNGPVARFLARVSELLRRVEDAALVILLGAMILIGGAQIVMRNVFGEALAGGDETQRLIVLWLAILGAVAASRDRKQLRIDLVSRYLRGRLRLALEAFPRWDKIATDMGQKEASAFMHHQLSSVPTKDLVSRLT